MLGTVGTPIVDSAIDEIKRQIDLFDIDGVKLYPAFFYDGIGAGLAAWTAKTGPRPFLEFCQ